MTIVTYAGRPKRARTAAITGTAWHEILRRGEQMLGRARKRLGKRAKKGFCGYPVATVALYGPDVARIQSIAMSEMAVG